MHHHDQDNDESDQDFFGKGRLQRPQGFLDKLGSVVKGDDGELAYRSVRERLGRKAGRQFRNFFLHGLDGGQGVIAIAHDNHTTDDLRAALVQSATSQGRAQGNTCDVFDKNRGVVMSLDHGTFDVFDAFDETDAPNDIFDAVQLDGPSAHIDVGHADSIKDFFKGHAICAHGVGIDIDLIFLYVPAN